MQAQDYATVAVALITIIGAFATAIRWMVKHYLSELHKNGGTSLRDAIDRLENRVDDLFKLMSEK
jgi:hypothetical protein